MVHLTMRTNISIFGRFVNLRCICNIIIGSHLQSRHKRVKAI